MSGWVVELGWDGVNGTGRREPRASVRSFEDLHVWKLARNLRQKIYEASEGFPRQERYVLVKQIRRAAISVTANIAEGFGRFHYQENIQFCRQARGSLFELVDHLITARDQGYIRDDAFNELKAQTYECIKVLNAYIASIDRHRRTTQQPNTPLPQ